MGKSRQSSHPFTELVRNYCQKYYFRFTVEILFFSFPAPKEADDEEAIVAEINTMDEDESNEFVSQVLQNKPSTAAVSETQEQATNRDGGTESTLTSDTEPLSTSNCTITRIWSPEESGYLLTLYEENLHEFKDPNIRKNGIWCDFASAINRKFGTKFTSTQVNQKFRNFKYEFEKAYIRGRKTAFHYDKLLRIFADKLPERGEKVQTQFPTVGETQEYKNSDVTAVRAVQMIGDNGSTPERCLQESSAPVWVPQDPAHPTQIVYHQMGKMQTCSSCHPVVTTAPMSVHHVHTHVQMEDVSRPQVQIVPISQETEFCCGGQQQNGHSHIADGSPTLYASTNSRNTRLVGTHVKSHHISPSSTAHRLSTSTNTLDTVNTAKTKDLPPRQDYTDNGNLSDSYDTNTSDQLVLSGARKRKARPPSPTPSNPLKKLMNLLPSRNSDITTNDGASKKTIDRTSRSHLTSGDNVGNVSEIVRVLDEWKEDSAKLAAERERREEERHQESMAVASRMLDLFQAFIDKLGAS